MHKLKPKIPVYASFVEIRLIYTHGVALDLGYDLTDSSLHSVFCNIHQSAPTKKCWSCWVLS